MSPGWRQAAWGLPGVLLVLLVLALGFGLDPHAVPSTRQGLPAPAFDLEALDGNRITLGQLRGRPAVINFWATWCYPCQAEAPVLLQAARRLQDRVQFLGVIYQDEVQSVRRALGPGPAAYPQLIDAGSRMAIDYGVAGVPETFFVSAQGVVTYKHAGVLSDDLLERQLRPLLAAAGGSP